MFTAIDWVDGEVREYNEELALETCRGSNAHPFGHVEVLDKLTYMQRLMTKFYHEPSDEEWVNLMIDIVSSEGITVDKHDLSEFELDMHDGQHRLDVDLCSDDQLSLYMDLMQNLLAGREYPLRVGYDYTKTEVVKLGGTITFEWKFSGYGATRLIVENCPYLHVRDIAMFAQYCAKTYYLDYLKLVDFARLRSRVVELERTVAQLHDLLDRKL